MLIIYFTQQVLETSVMSRKTCDTIVYLRQIPCSWELHGKEYALPCRKLRCWPWTCFGSQALPVNLPGHRRSC